MASKPVYHTCGCQRSGSLLCLLWQTLVHKDCMFPLSPEEEENDKTLSLEKMDDVCDVYQFNLESWMVFTVHFVKI